jgi:hypothetical protein
MRKFVQTASVDFLILRCEPQASLEGRTALTA